MNWKDDPLRVELRAVYDEVDGLMAPLSCAQSADCCQFGKTGREPHPTAIELAEIEWGVKRAGGMRRRLPLAPQAKNGKGDCPFLDRVDGREGGRCRIYASRPFGCRTYFCERVEGGKVPRVELLRLGQVVAALAARFAPRDPHPRPMVRALAQRLGL